MKSKYFQFEDNDYNIFKTVYGHELLTKFLRECIHKACMDKSFFDLVMFGKGR